ncbi:MAG: hypothetical protein HKN71_09980 [Gemmatimonadetes bacterium]|nr:hypothetical protein [Gemmatimonadota bacterium]
MRHRDRILASLEGVYREAFDAARTREDGAAADRLDFEFQRDQIHLEVLLDLRDLLFHQAEPDRQEEESGSSVTDLLDKAQKLRRFTRPL